MATEQPAAGSDCACGTPSQANYYTRVVHDDPDGETTYSDLYTCSDHTVPLDPYNATTDPSEPDRAAVARMIGWSDPDTLIIHEVEQTELR